MQRHPVSKKAIRAQLPDDLWDEMSGRESLVPNALSLWLSLPTMRWSPSWVRLKTQAEVLLVKAMRPLSYLDGRQDFGPPS
jgi:hypothetical protein